MADDALSAGAVARRLGVAVTTLRTWHQRYGLGPSRHVPGHHRRYTAEDLRRLEVMRRLTARGVPPAEAAGWACRAPLADSAGAATGSGAAGRRDGGGHTLAVGDAGREARGLARAAMRLDAPAIRDLLRSAVAGRGVIGAWDGVIRPVLRTVGDRHAATAGLVEVEHTVSRCVCEVLAAVPRPALPVSGPRILLACADEEQHSLPLEALAAALAEAGADARMLGARVPPTALVEAIARTGPVAVVVWSHTGATGDPAQLTALLDAPHRPLLVLAAGPGWPADDRPADVLVPESLADAVRLALTALRDRRITETE